MGLYSSLIIRDLIEQPEKKKEQIAMLDGNKHLDWIISCANQVSWTQPIIKKRKKKERCLLFYAKMCV